MRSAVDSYVHREIDVDGFREAFVGAYFYVRNSAVHDQEAQLLASRLMGPVAEFSAGHRTEASLRMELANAIRPVERTLRLDSRIPTDRPESKSKRDLANRFCLSLRSVEALWVLC